MKDPLVAHGWRWRAWARVATVHLQQAIRVDGTEPLAGTVQPAHLDRVDAGRGSEPEVQHRVHARDVAAHRILLDVLTRTSREQGDARTEARAVARRSGERDAEPVAPLDALRAVHVQRRR